MNEVHPVKEVLLLISQDHGHQFAHTKGTSRPPRKQTHFLHYHQSVLDILTAHHEPLDGSVVIVNPENNEPFAMWDHPYGHVKFNGTLQVVSRAALQPKAVPAPEPEPVAPETPGLSANDASDAEKRKACFDKLRAEYENAHPAELPEDEPAQTAADPAD